MRGCKKEKSAERKITKDCLSEVDYMWQLPTSFDKPSWQLPGAVDFWHLPHYDFPKSIIINLIANSLLSTTS
jgi:hypothetical protein